MSMNSAASQGPRVRAKANREKRSREIARKPPGTSPSHSDSTKSKNDMQQDGRIQASKMQAIGQLAGGIAHDFNNLLTVILGHSEFLLKRKEPPEAARSRVEEIRKAAERGAWLTSQLLAYSRNQILEPAVLQINSTVEDMDGILRCVLGEDVALDLVIDPNLGWTRVDPGKFQQIVLNLAGNARDAMPRGGRLRIETSNVSIPASGPKPQPFLAPGDYISLIVRDSGQGMDSKTRARIFEPFFTTKEKGKGTGLGLATVYGIVKQSGGYIWVESEIGRGSAFHTLLPRVPAPVVSGVQQKVFDFRSGGESVLLVEDDPAVRRLSADALRGAGYQVYVAPSAADALRLAENLKTRLDLLLTDVVMPGMTGAELANQFRWRFPKVRILYMTGYTDDALGHHGLQGQAGRILQKPFTHEMLARRVSEALAPTACDFVSR
jgi:two-component system, cell cycle sensor histidine kinase and response regulator CckA